MATEREEVVVDPDCSGCPALRTRCRQLFFESGARAHIRGFQFGRVSSGAGSARRLILPLGVSGNASSATKIEGTMYSGNRVTQMTSQFGDVTGRAPDRTQ